MAKLGDDVYGWDVDQLANWLQAEGLSDCVKTFAGKKIDGCKLLNLTDGDIRNLHVSTESKRKLIRAVDKFHKKRKEKRGRMFGNDVVTRKPSSISNDEGGSDYDEGWDSEEWDSGSEGGESSSDTGGEYLEPEDDFSKPQGQKGSFEKETAAIQSGLVAQLRQGIAQSLSRDAFPAPSQDLEDEDIYDVPPEEEEDDGDLYEEPSDSSGGAVVVRPPPKPPRVPNDAEYLLPRGGEEQQDMYEAPIEGEDISPAPAPFANWQNKFIPTKVAQGNKFVNIHQDKNDNLEYDVPDLDDSDDDSYEIPETGTQAAPPPRPPKNIGKKVPAAQPSPVRPPKQTPSNIVKSGRPPPQENIVPYPKPSSISKHGTPFQPQSSTLPSQRSPPHHPKQITPQNKPSTLPKQVSPTHRPKPNTLSAQGTPFQGPSTTLPSPRSPTKLNTQGPPPLQPKAMTQQVMQPKVVPQPSEEKRPPLAPKVSPRPKPAADVTRRGPVPPPANEPTRKISVPRIGPPESPKRISEPANEIPEPIQTESKKGPLPVPPAMPGKTSPRITPRGGLLGHRDSPSVPSTELPQRSGPPLPPGSGRRPPSLPDSHEKPSVPSPAPTEPPPPPRPPRQGSAAPVAQPALPARQGPSDRKSALLPAPPTEKKSGPPPPMSSHPSMSSSREQSSASSIESGSADEPVVLFGKKKTPTQRNAPPHRGLPPTPDSKSPLEMMKEAPWFHGPVDRKKSEVNLKSTKMDGAFLVRNSTQNPNDYSLSLLYKGNIRHLKLPKKDGKYVLGASGVQKFDTIIDLINYYRQHDVDLASGGKTKLTIHAQNIA